MAETRRDFMKFIAGGVASIGLLAVPRIAEEKVLEIFDQAEAETGFAPRRPDEKLNALFDEMQGLMQDHMAAAGFRAKSLVGTNAGKDFSIHVYTSLVDRVKQEPWHSVDWVDPADLTREMVDLIARTQLIGIRRAEKYHKARFVRVSRRERWAARRRLRA